MGTSWGGTSNETVLRSILTKLSRHGIIKNRPGPFGSDKARPRRNMTPLSYSCIICNIEYILDNSSDQQNQS